MKYAIPIQVTSAVLIGIAGMAIAHYGGFRPGSEYFAVLLAMTFYVLFNCLFSITQKSIFRYTLPSIYSYVAFSAVLLLTARRLSGVSLWDAWEYRMMIVSLSLFYFILSFLVRVMRFIMEMSGGEDVT
ncbi:MAG: hypothetical protein NZM35_10120 [Chitinophagales bacterium]|nr:hypothetical protein [Chitinophagales bacterium]MDW8419632.1 hypothetical protein [Chitinophagales bacterium]